MVELATLFVVQRCPNNNREHELGQRSQCASYSINMYACAIYNVYIAHSPRCAGEVVCNLRQQRQRTL